MCGNFGLLALAAAVNPLSNDNASNHNPSFHKPIVAQDPLDQSINESMHQVSKSQGIRFRADSVGDDVSARKEKPLSVVKILEAQTACTEIRGGQAGGFSSLEYEYVTKREQGQSHFDSLFQASAVPIAKNVRVRMVARKRHPLAADLSKLYMHQRFGRLPDPKATITVIGHTRFATSSINKVTELHPHEWVPFHDEVVWLFNASSGKFEKATTTVGIHISHNGDFDAMSAYSQVMVVNEIGLWLERVLHTPNNTNSDSSKIAGCMDLMRVQGRWSAAARLAYVRCVLSSPLDVSGGEQLSKAAQNTMPLQSHWAVWGDWFDLMWSIHLNNMITIIPPGKFDLVKRNYYSINEDGVKQFINCAVTDVQSKNENVKPEILTAVKDWSTLKLQAFIHHAVRGFLRGDLYTAMTELLSRAEGSFGLQAHCTLEPGVVIIASKGQPMSLSYDPYQPIVLFASEAEALAVPVYESGRWLSQRIDLDSHGEIFRLGVSRSLVEGSFIGKDEEKAKALRNNQSSQLQSRQQQRQQREENFIQEEIERKGKLPYLLLDCGVEIRSYSLVTSKEATAKSLLSRSLSITSAPIPYDPKVDLVAADLKVTPAVLNAIDHAWSNPQSIERVAGNALAQNLVGAMHKRIVQQKDTIDLIIAGVEVSLWLAEQFAADLRLIFPNLNVATVSANKLLGTGDESATKVFFPGSDEILRRRIDKNNTCVLLISQSGQTFPTLHATRKMVKMTYEKVWILTGCFHSKMEQVIIESYHEHHVQYQKNRVFNNYSGHRPAEPSSVAVAATWHTLTRLLLLMVDVCRQKYAALRFIHPWEYDRAALIIQAVFMRHLYLKRRERAKLEEEAKNEDNFTMQSPLRPNTTGPDRSLGKSISFLRPKSSFSMRLFDESSRTAPGLEPLQGQNSSFPCYIPSSFSSPIIMLNLSDGCIDDLKSLVSECLIPNISDIVGFDQFAEPIDRQNTEIVNDKLVKQGKAWAKHINEPWHMLIFVGIYIILSVGCSITIFGIIGDAILSLVRACIGNGELVGHHALGGGYLVFTPRIPSVIYHQGIGYTLIGALLQLLDGIFFVYLVKNFTRLARLIDGRPYAARHGKRTIVIVDTPAVHQLTEIFVSKLFSQSYSIVSVDVHGASGLDHFVHRFTHRVARGLLIALGRPDGRLCCLAKSEASVLLAAKQAAFIRNPSYEQDGSSPEFVTVGHNPYQPNLGLATHIVLEGSEKSLSHYSTHHSTTGVMRITGRRKFVDEYLYDRLFLAQKPFTVSILRALRRTMELGSQVVRANHHRLNSSVRGEAGAKLSRAVFRKGSLNTSTHYKPPRRMSNASAHNQISDEVIPYGVHHIDPQILINSDSISLSVFADFVATNREVLHANILKSDKIAQLKEKSFDPAVRSAFSSKLDAQTRQVQELQTIVQQFYECRIASLERYLSFCVMFHAMAADCSKPWLLTPWDIARSQSNLRVATTACPISSHASHAETSSETKKLARQLAFILRKFYTNF